ncbi:TetR/AcrR family transcriptional regulator [Solimonas fluminis]|uniref:TetR/AcrR family transcriptional regulator n=1 Tax=Solimonas fluminis TaxID=2086571 RepID=A0A2S5TAR5_9GAMM|nr:TetR/AcrR family transcriptional regulator [Solimonas fluminis]PPE72090.1 TetR/AcrR family transcriptional regulator [Solimonas fluminis]
MDHIKENLAPAGVVTDARMLRTRKALREALLALIERKQLDEITIRDIAAEAGIGYATFFRHHGSKADLLDDVAAEQIAQLMARTLPLMESTDTKAGCRALAEYVHANRAIWSALLTGGASGAMRETFIRMSVQGAAHIKTLSWLPVELGAVFGVGATVEILAWWLRRPDEVSTEQIAEILHRLVVVPTVGSG